MDLEKILHKVIPLAHQACQEILQLYKSPLLKIEVKRDSTRVTSADYKANAVLEPGLKLIFDVDYISEENPYRVVETGQYWLVDPLDGTEEFIKQTDQFAVNIALMLNHKPVLGVVAIPITGEVFWALKDHGAYKTQGHATERLGSLSTGTPPEDQWVCISSRREWNNIEMLKRYFPKAGIRHYGSAIKFCHLADKKAHIYLRSGLTSEWDTAAPEIILREAGGDIFDMDGQALRYNKPSPLNPGFVALSHKDFHKHVEPLMAEQRRLHAPNL